MTTEKDAPPKYKIPSTLPIIAIGAFAAVMLLAWPFLLLAELPRLQDFVLPILSFAAFFAALRFWPQYQTLIAVLLLLVLYGPAIRHGATFWLVALPGIVVLVMLAAVQLIRAWLNRPKPTPPPIPPKITDANFAADADLKGRGIIDER